MHEETREVIHSTVQRFHSVEEDLNGRILRSVAHARCSVG